MQQLFLYTTLGCHLCEEAAALAEPVAERHGLRLTQVEIADDPVLLETYGTRIPVLREAQGAELGWPFDAETMQTWLGNL